MKTITPSMDLIMTLSSLQSFITKKIDQRLNIHGISFTEFMVLYHLNEAPDKTMRRIDLAESVDLSASGVTRVLAPMEKNRLVQKEANPRDARVSLVKLSKTGERVFNEAFVTFDERASSITETLDTKQIAKFIEIAKLLS